VIVSLSSSLVYVCVFVCFASFEEGGVGALPRLLLTQQAIEDFLLARVKVQGPSSGGLRRPRSRGGRGDEAVSCSVLANAHTVCFGTISSTVCVHVTQSEDEHMLARSPSMVGCLVACTLSRHAQHVKTAPPISLVLF
jgi:hypothetical protein